MTSLLFDNPLFNPSNTGVGKHIINYTISSTCDNSDQIAIEVIENFDATYKGRIGFIR